jgi:hypothetical protein
VIVNGLLSTDYRLNVGMRVAGQQWELLLSDLMALGRSNGISIGDDDRDRIATLKKRVYALF